MKKTLLALSVAATSFSAVAFEFHGYGRSGLSTTGNGEQNCYGNGGDGHFVGRLGDECDTYVELGLAKDVYNKDGKTFRIETMWSSDIGNQGNDYQGHNANNDPWGGGDWALRQFNVQATGVLEFAPEATLWAGKRYYQRKDVHFLDFYYLNNSGYGVGVEHIDMGPGKLSVAWTNNDTISEVSQKNPHDTEGSILKDQIQSNKIDVRYAGIPLWGDTKLELVGIYGFADLTNEQEAQGFSDEDGYFVTAEVTMPFLGGFNKFVGQYAKDSMGNSAWVNHSGQMTWNNYGDDEFGAESSFRLMSWGVVPLASNIELGYSAIYQEADVNGDVGYTQKDEDGNTREIIHDTAKRTSIVARPSYHWNETMATTIEVGYDKVRNFDDESSRDLYKFVVAQEFKAGSSMFSRPAIRVYAGSFWGDQAKEIDDDGEIRVGAQVEAWW
ncbi:carbohydrate porin [Echinimonas agarilytica]|uniref:Carbohydrate porin n=1 Tax=Echinimonas agarilytica TaxID=1215918 RepID=A0AA42B734_9GAMM|nr:carbohydrate porin [Echinimonas agarilytica]MCM2679449.1 carbohydrate porin [Echinimonas agarilytica]